MGATFAEALAALDAARLLGIGTSEGGEFVAVARPILEQLGAVSYLRRLEALGTTGDRADARPAPAAADAEVPVSRSA